MINTVYYYYRKRAQGKDRWMIYTDFCLDLDLSFIHFQFTINTDQNKRTNR